MNDPQTQNPVDVADLAQFDDAYREAQVEERRFEEVPDGKYQVVIDRVEMTRSKEQGTPMLKWALRILGPIHKNQLLWRNNVLATAENVKWLKTDLFTCGLVLDKLSELPANLERLLDVKLEVTKRTRGEFSNIYLNRRIVTDDAPAGGNDVGDTVPW